MIKLLPARMPHPGNTLRTVVMACAALLVFSACDSAVDAHEEDPEEEIERTYTKNIERTYANEFERALIDSAEAAYPLRDSVLAATSNNFREHIPETGYWFYRVIDQVLLPFAITVDAVNYYSSLIDSMEAGATHQFIYSAEFEYRASVSFEETYEFQWPEEWDDRIRQMYVEISGNALPIDYFEHVYVVKMTKSWSHYCEDDCALWSSLVRIVIFDESLNLIQIYFDGAWWVPVVS